MHLFERAQTHLPEHLRKGRKNWYVYIYIYKYKRRGIRSGRKGKWKIFGYFAFLYSNSTVLVCVCAQKQNYVQGNGTLLSAAQSAPAHKERIKRALRVCFAVHLCCVCVCWWIKCYLYCFCFCFWSCWRRKKEKVFSFLSPASFFRQLHATQTGIHAYTHTYKQIHGMHIVRVLLASAESCAFV